MSISLCTTCREHPAKYKCPACVSHTCSLTCSKRHKLSTNCSGKRNQTTFIPRSKFDDASINNDYNFLTTLERDLDNASRLNNDSPVGRNFNQVKGFVKRAHDVGEVTVKLAPRGMKRARTNKSSWVAKKSQLSWTVEWLFEGSVRKVSDRVFDSVSIAEAVSFYKGRVADELDSFRAAPIESLHFLMKDEDITGSQPTYAVLEPHQTIGEALRHRTIIEYPTILVYVTIPPHVKLERQYGYAQPTAESISAATQTAQAADGENNTGGDFIAFNLDNDDDDDEDGQAEEVEVISAIASGPRKDAQASLSGLPVVDFDDLEVPYF
ncbi:protein of unknown function [Taphrina deformans PYCC 5710]|uniref:HIT-type domain-containing protein n=1 Tax=Taphrina deformans (strain PYCC 5710 / ATCC 11124 / CBS 356.35 / IMI 108563 / JCM 9778 / NBRC 8474) TaxID=1097556 RepID=R4XH64_TAPDE|nr:protein of unknown function [Taphrina deformans PYCC 5710]|eukprot:CCG83863.1 protein of unknown function [Taphrina deformans PYCC 5710]